MKLILKSKMPTKKITTVCTGNSGRSPVLEVIAKNRIAEHGLSDQYEVNSAGTLVDTINSGEYSIDGMKKFIDRAIERGDIYTPSQEKQLNSLVAQYDETEDPAALTKIQKMFGRTVQAFHSEELSSRAYAIREFGLPNDNLLKEGHDQFHPRGPAAGQVAVLTVDVRNKGVVNDMYDEQGVPKPQLIEVVTQVPGNPGEGNPNAQVADAFGLPREAYMKAFEQLMQQGPEATDYILSNLCGDYVGKYRR